MRNAMNLQSITRRKQKDEIVSTINRKEIEYELSKLEGTYCPTNEEKYHILLKRDNLLAKLRTKSTDFKQAKKLSASCQDMCPEKERYTRQVGNLLHPYECNPDGTVNHALAVKDYARSAADQEEPLPHELRPPDVLQKTMDYLILKTLPAMSRSELVKWYDFFWSRSRSIRKEITQQMLNDKTAVSLVEKCARFHIYASFCMSTLGTNEFDDRMNSENLSKCLQTLRHLYDDLAHKSIYCESEAEFRAYDILMNLNDSNVLSIIHTYREEVRNSNECQLAAQLACSFQTDNFVAFFRLIRQKASYLQACLCRNYFNSIRSKSLHVMVRVSRPANIPIFKFTDWLAFDDDRDTLAFMKALDLHVDGDGLISGGDDYHIYGEVDDEKTNYGCQVIEQKLLVSLPELISGGPCFNPTFPPPVNSFVSDYYGKQKNLNLFPPAKPKEPQLPVDFGDKARTRLLDFKPTFPPPVNSLGSDQYGNHSKMNLFPPVKPKETQLPLDFGDRARTSLVNSKPTFPPPINSLGSESYGNHSKINLSPLVKPKDPQLPTDFGNKAKTRLVDEILNFCTDDFIFFAAYDRKKRREELELELQQEKAELTIQKLPKLGVELKQQLFEDILNYCIDDFIWFAAHNVREVAKKVDIILEKHNLRIVRPFAQKWLSVTRFRMFVEHLPQLNTSKRLSQSPMEGPDAKRSKKFTPMKFSTKF